MAKIVTLKDNITGESVYPQTMASATYLEGGSSVEAELTGLSQEVTALGQEITDLSFGKFYGFFPDAASLPEGDESGYAYVGATAPFAIYVFNGVTWDNSGSVSGPAEGNEEDINSNLQGKLQFANRSTTYGMGYKILRRDASLTRQITDSDTIYEIRYDFYLGGDTVIVPSGCVLKFVGGSISGGTLSFSQTKIEGQAKILCDIAGTISECADLDWFGATPGNAEFDNGPVLNKVSAICKNIILNPGDYYFSTPIIINRPKNINFKGRLLYNGNSSNISLVSITSNSTTAIFEDAQIFINEVYVNKNSVDYSAGSNSGLVGIDLVNCNSSNIVVGRISGPNTGFRVFGNGKGCCYNRIRINQILYFNYGIRFYQDNGGWANENTVLGTNIQKISDFTPEILCPIYICGPQTETDTYDHINSLSFNEICTEGFDTNPVMYMRNVEYCNVNRMRCERSSIIAKFVGACNYNNFVDSGYGYNRLVLSLSYFDLSEATSYPFSSSCRIRTNEEVVRISTENKTISSTEYVAVDGFASWSTHNTSGGRKKCFKVGNHYVGVVVGVSTRADAVVFGRSTTSERFVVLPLEAVINGETVTDINVLKTYVPIAAGGASFAWNASEGIFKSGSNGTSTYLYVPSPITKFFVGFKALADTTVDFAINRLRPSLQTYILRKGTTDQRPPAAGTSGSAVLSSNEIGLEYFDTTLGEPVYWAGSGWVDASGTTV